MSDTLSYEQACAMAVQLRNQGQTFPKIAEHFKRIGYVSSRTKKPPGDLAVRHMIIETEKKKKLGEMPSKRAKRTLDPDETGEISLSSPGFKDTVMKLASLNGISEDTFVSLIEALIAQRKKGL